MGEAARTMAEAMATVASGARPEDGVGQAMEPGWREVASAAAGRQGNVAKEGGVDLAAGMATAAKAGRRLCWHIAVVH